MAQFWLFRAGEFSYFFLRNFFHFSNIDFENLQQNNYLFSTLIKFTNLSTSVLVKIKIFGCLTQIASKIIQNRNLSGKPKFFNKSTLKHEEQFYLF